MGKKPAILQSALGTFIHEAVTVDLKNNCLYLTEDVPDGGFYRFRASNALPDLTKGTLEIAKIKQRGGSSYIKWIPVPDPLASKIPTRAQVSNSARFAGGEGIDIFQNKVYFTTKYDNRVWSYNTNNQKLRIIYDITTSHNPILKGVDNLIVTPAGDILVTEDMGNMQIIVITPRNKIKPLIQIICHLNSVVTGPAFDPSFFRLYFSSQRGTSGKSSGGITYEVSYVG